MQAERRWQEREYTYKDYLTWPEDEHWEIIDGKAYPTYGPTALASPTWTHQRLVSSLSRLIGNYLVGKQCQVAVAPLDVVFEKSKDTKIVVQPDILVVCDPSKIENGKRVIGAPDITIEVLSPSTTSKDWLKKLRLYESQGVREYWIVNPDERAIYKNTLKDGQYQMEVLEEEGFLTSEVLEDFSLDIGDFFKALGVRGQGMTTADLAEKEQEARREERLEIAKKALQEGVSAELVQKISGLDAATMERLKAEAISIKR